ncbi:MAG: helix-turn-helix domain-containing protein [Bacteroidaceae bacterium]|nr:helix-turn-helix domain-containing protein [Bacteroidaceae bacterium]
MNEHLNFKYLPSIEHDLDWGLTVNCVGMQEILPGEPYPPAMHPMSYRFQPAAGRILDEYQLVYCSKGAGMFRTETAGEMHVKAGDVMMLFPQERHTYYPDEKTGWKEYWIGFRGPNIEMRVQNGFFSTQHPLFHLPITKNRDIVYLFNLGITAAQHMEKGYQQLLSGYVNMMLGYLLSYDITSSQAEKETTEDIHQALLYIHNHFHEDIRSEDVARAINWGYSHFRKVFLQQTGMTPYQYIQETRIKESKFLLLNTTKALKEIAYEVGFNNPDYFSTAFRRITGVSPLSFRKDER